jgi:proteasome lid subunit RPN8/RPN11
MKRHKGEEVSVLPDEPSIVWQESEIAYRPIEQPLSEFLSPRNLSVPSESSALLVFIRQSCIAAMESHVRQDILREQAGILCGQAYRDPSGQHYIEVTAAVAVQTLNSSSYFRFHERSWQAVWETMGNDGNILGWYHSHPGMGIFLSATDLRTQELYFGAPWQIAVVLDPVSREIGAFHQDQRISIHTIG